MRHAHNSKRTGIAERMTAAQLPVGNAWQVIKMLEQRRAQKRLRRSPLKDLDPTLLDLLLRFKERVLHN